MHNHPEYFMFGKIEVIFPYVPVVDVVVLGHFLVIGEDGEISLEITEDPSEGIGKPAALLGIRGVTDGVRRSSFRLSLSIRSRVCPNMEDGPFPWAAGKTSTADLGFMLASASFHFAHSTRKPCLVDGQLFLEPGIAGYKSALRMFDIAGLLLEKSRDRRLEFRPGVLLSVGSKKNFVSSTRLSTPEPAFS